jgi:hypothetical protein
LSLRLRRWLLAGAAVAAVALGVVIFAAHDARHRILQALGPRTTVGSISLDYPTVTLRDVHVAASDVAGAWPAREEFAASEVAVDITAASLWAYRRGAPLVIADVRVRDGTLVMLRTPGHLDLLPALRDTSRDAAATSGSATALVISHLRVDRMAVDLHDATLPGGKEARLRFEQVGGTVDGLALPGLATPITLALQGVLKGVERDGPVSLRGRLAPATQDARLAIRLDGVDMIALQPYVLRFGQRPVRHGTLDLALDAAVTDRAVHAPGQLTITGLAFGDPPGGALAGLGRRATLAALERDGRIALRFTLEGRTDDPRFSLDENLAVRVAAGLGEAVGSSVEGVAQGVGGVVRDLLGGPREKPAR